MPSEKVPFHEHIKPQLGCNLTTKQAIGILLHFHTDSTKNAIVQAFPYLQDPNVRVRFEESINSGYDCIAMKHLRADGTWTHNKSGMHYHNGQPQAWCG